MLRTTSGRSNSRLLGASLCRHPSLAPISDLWVFPVSRLSPDGIYTRRPLTGGYTTLLSCVPVLFYSSAFISFRPPVSPHDRSSRARRLTGGYCYIHAFPMVSDCLPDLRIDMSRPSRASTSIPVDPDTFGCFDTSISFDIVHPGSFSSLISRIFL